MMVAAEDTRLTVSRFVTALAKQQLDEVRLLLRDEFVVHEAGGLPFSGTFHGPDGFLQLLGTMNERLELELSPGSGIQYLAAGNTVAMRTRMKFTARASGNSVETGLVEIYTVRDRRIAELDVYYKDPSAVTALLSR